MEPFNEIIEPLIKKMSSDEEKYFNIQQIDQLEI